MSLGINRVCKKTLPEQLGLDRYGVSQWRSSHLDILDLSRGGRIRGGGKIWPKIKIGHCKNYSALLKIF